MITRAHAGWVFGLVFVAGLAACDGTIYEAEIDLTRIVADPLVTSTTNKVSDHERFGYKSPEDVGPPRFGYELPKGWTELAPREFRQINLRPADKVQCYLTILPGGGGTRIANINRWRGMVGLSAVSASEVARLPKVRLNGLDRDAVRLDVVGSYKGMADKTASADYRFIGHIWDWGDYGCYFVFVGPKKTIEAELPKFEGFLRSLRQVKGKASAASQPSDGQLAWDLPKGWVEGPAKSMRLVTFLIGADKKTECYVAQAGGSPEDNITRWRRQLGQPPLSSDEFGKLPRVRVQGLETILMTAKGDFGGGMGAAPVKDAMMRGAIIPGREVSLFVKMLGPRATVEAQLEQFKRFVTSLRPRGKPSPHDKAAGQAGGVGPTKENAKAGKDTSNGGNGSNAGGDGKNNDKAPKETSKDGSQTGEGRK